MSSGGSTVELDFFSVEEETRAVGPKPLMTTNKLSDERRRRSFRDIQNVISKIDPEVVKAVIGCSAGSVKTPTITVPSVSVSSSCSTPREHQTNFPMIPPLPIYVAPTNYRRPTGDCESETTTAPLTIFYNGTVAVFDRVPRNQAECILVKLAEEDERRTNVDEADGAMKVGFPPNEFVGNFSGNIPLARRRSLERLLAKRKERLVMCSPHIKG